MKIYLILCFSALLAKSVMGDTLLPPDPFGVDDIKTVDNGSSKGDKKDEVKKSKSDKKDEKESKSQVDKISEVEKTKDSDSKNDEKTDGKKEDSKDKDDSIEIKSTKPSVTGEDNTKVGADQDEPEARSVKSSDGENDDKKDDSKKKNSKEGGKEGSKTTFVDIPDSILKSVEEKEKSNLRGETAEVKGDKGDKDGSSESGDESKEDDKDSETKKDPVLESIIGAEKQLSEAFGVVKSKIQTVGKGQRPIKVDCGTTRVRVVCSKKKGDKEEKAEVEKESPGKEEVEEQTESDDTKIEDLGSSEETPEGEEESSS